MVFCVQRQEEDFAVETVLPQFYCFLTVLGVMHPR
jgi:hypothetical protein